MHAIKPSRRHVAGMASLTCTLAIVALSFASLPAGAQTASTTTACPFLSVGNPNPGDDLIPGDYFISGSAYDPAATSGAGITRVDFFLGERDQGGTFLGSAIPGNVPGGSARQFSTKVTVPDENTSVDFAAYAISAVTGQQTIITFPVLVGVPAAKQANATPTPVPTTENVTSTCPGGAAAATPGAVMSGSAPAAATPVPAAAAPAAPAAAPMMAMGGAAPAANSCPVLSVANPNPGDNLIPGNMFISGTAYDPAATSGAGITRVDFFLGERDQGGTFLGSGVPGAVGSNPRAFDTQVTVPSENRGLDFAAYAISAVTGQETVVTFPILVGAPTKPSNATPTPIPLVETVTNTCGH